MKKIFLIILLLVAIKQASAQKQGPQRIDSLLTDLAKAKEDTNKVNLLADLCITFNRINPDEGIKYGEQAIKLSEKIKWQKGVVTACNNTGANYGSGKSDYPKALEYFLKALKVSEDRLTENVKNKSTINYPLNSKEKKSE